MGAQNAAIGYVALKKETTPGVPVTPNVFVPYYSQNIKTDMKVIEDEPISGQLFGRFQTLPGIRSHAGTITVMAEPNTLGYWLDMLTTRASTSGAGPYTHTYNASITTPPNTYTMDISVGSQVIRFWGVQASKIQFSFDGQKMVLIIDISALGSFYGREITSVSTTTVNLTTDYDTNATLGLVASDTINIQKVDNSTTLNTTVSSITDGDTFVAGASAAAFAAGDMVRLRPATPSFSLLTPFTWPKTQFFFAANGSTAISNSATASNQTRLDSGTEVSLSFPFENPDGEPRSGGYDPAALLRTTYDLTFKKKQYFDNSEEIKYWNKMDKRAAVMVSYAGATNQYKLQLAMYDIKARSNDMPTEMGKTIYHEIDYATNYSSSDGKAFEIVLLNSVATI